MCSFIALFGSWEIEVKEKENKLQILDFFYFCYSQTGHIKAEIEIFVLGATTTENLFSRWFFFFCLVLFFWELMGCENTINLQNFLVNVGFFVIVVLSSYISKQEGYFLELGTSGNLQHQTI